MARAGTELRKSLREKRRQAGLIAVATKPAPMACVVWDLSRQGARLTAAHSASLPDVFTLILGKDDRLRHRCRVVWRKAPYLGVKFIEAAEADRLEAALMRPLAPKNSLNWLSAPGHRTRRERPRNPLNSRSLLDFF